MTRTLYDSTNARDIPDDAQMVAGYLDGNYYWKEADFDRWAHVPRIFIAVFPTTLHGNCLDVEPGNSTPDDRRIGDWVMNRREHGIEPTIYTMLSWWDDLQASFSRWGIREPLWWIASWDGRREMINGAMGKQYLHGDPGKSFYSGGHYDVTVCADEWPGVDGGVLIPKPPTGPGGGGAGTTYIVQPGDSLSGIGQKFGVSWQAIHAANQWIQNPNYIQVGWALTIPGAPSTGPAPLPPSRTYTVQPGDNLSLIAVKYGTSWQAIYSANRDRINNPDYIQVGWVLRIP